MGAPNDFGSKFGRKNYQNLPNIFLRNSQPSRLAPAALLRVKREIGEISTLKKSIFATIVLETFGVLGVIKSREK